MVEFWTLSNTFLFYFSPTVSKIRLLKDRPKALFKTLKSLSKNCSIEFIKSSPFWTYCSTTDFWFLMDLLALKSITTCSPWPSGGSLKVLRTGLLGGLKSKNKILKICFFFHFSRNKNKKCNTVMSYILYYRIWNKMLQKWCSEFWV